MASIKYEAAAIATMLSTELNALANAAAALGVEYDNATGLYTHALFQLEVTFAVAPTANSTVDLYIIPASDGTNYTDYTAGAAGKAPYTGFIGGIPLEAKTTIHRVAIGYGRDMIILPPTKFKILAINKSGQAFPASGSTIKMIPQRYQN